MDTSVVRLLSGISTEITCIQQPARGLLMKASLKELSPAVRGILTFPQTLPSIPQGRQRNICLIIYHRGCVNKKQNKQKQCMIWASCLSKEKCMQSCGGCIPICCSETFLISISDTENAQQVLMLIVVKVNIKTYSSEAIWF